MTNWKHALPPRHWIRPYDRMHRLNHRPHVSRRTARLVVDVNAGLLGEFVEARWSEFCRQGLKKLLIGRRDAVVDLAAGCPKGVFLFHSSACVKEGSDKIWSSKRTERTYHRLSQAAVSTSTTYNPPARAQMGYRYASSFFQSESCVFGSAICCRIP